MAHTLPAHAPEPYARTGFKKTMQLARRIFAVHATQPATAVWRLVETRIVLENLAGEGRGLDLGCGDGTLATILFEKLPDVQWWGIDLDERDVSLARQRGVYEEVYMSSAAAIPEPDGSFDLVFSNSALEHMTPLADVLADAARVLKPGGRFVFTVPIADFHRHLLWGRILAGLGLSGLAERYIRHIDRRLAHTNYLSREQWIERITELGLEVRRTMPYLSRRSLACWETLANFTGGLAYLLAGGRRSPREIQRAFKLDEGTRPRLGDLFYCLLWPVVAFVAAERTPANCSALYVEAVRQGNSAT